MTIGELAAAVALRPEKYTGRDLSPAPKAPASLAAQNPTLIRSMLCAAPLVTPRPSSRRALARVSSIARDAPPVAVQPGWWPQCLA